MRADLRAVTLRGVVGRGAPWLVGAAAGALAVGPGLAPGLVLRYDMVFVPEPPLSAVTLGAGGGFPRAVPSDAVVGALGLVLPADVVQALALLTIFVVGSAGAARLVPGTGVLPGVAAGLCYVWNPFVAERLLLGQWAVLLGYAGLPWVLAAAVRLGRARDLPRTVVALLPATVGGFSAMVLSALVAVPAAVLRAPRSRGWRVGYSVVLLGVALLALSLPWLVPALSSDARTDPGAVDLFAARSDTPFGVVASLVTLGGIWNGNAVPVGQGQPFLAAGRLVLALATVAGWVWLLRRDRMVFGAGLTVAAVAGFGIALLGVVEPGRDLLRGLVAAWPGFGPLRDGHLYVAPFALVQAIGFSGVVRWLRERPGERVRVWRASAAAAGPIAAAMLVVIPVVFSPGLAWGAAGRLTPVEYPAEWQRVGRVVAEDPRPGAVLSLPWSAYRGLDWGRQGRTVVVLDPASKLFDRRVVWNDDLRVGSGGEVRVVEGEDPLARRVAPLLDSARPYEATPELAARLGELGVRYVVIDRVSANSVSERAGSTRENTFWTDLPGVRTLHEGSRLMLLELPDGHVEGGSADLSGLEVTGWLVTVGAIIWSLTASGSSLVPVRPGRPAGTASRKEKSK